MIAVGRKFDKLFNRQREQRIIIYNVDFKNIILFIRIVWQINKNSRKTII